MSRRGRHGRHPHPHARPDVQTGVVEGRSSDARPADARITDTRPEPVPAPPADRPAPSPAIVPPVATDTVAPAGTLAEPAPFRAPASPDRADAGPTGEDGRATCTTAQLRRFIKSRPWVPMHELRRRFGIYGGDDDVSPMRVGERTLFIGLPSAEARMMAELLSGGDVGYELSLDPGAPIVVGVYPMRPVPRG